MRRARRIAVAVTLLLVPAAASADPITIVHDQRTTSAATNATGISPQVELSRASDSLVSVVTTAPGASPSVASATLTSSFANTAHWFGAGTANVSWTAPADITAGSPFITDFDVTSPVDYAFTGSLAASNSACCGAPPLARATAALHLFSGVDRDGDAIFQPVFGFGAPGSSDLNGVTRSLTGLLLPGRYQLFVDAVTRGFAPNVTGRSGSAAANFAFTLDFTPADSSPSPTPEPASLLLLGSAIAGVFRCRRRSQ